MVPYRRLFGGKTENYFTFYKKLFFLIQKKTSVMSLAFYLDLQLFSHFHLEFLFIVLYFPFKFFHFSLDTQEPQC